MTAARLARIADDLLHDRRLEPADAVLLGLGLGAWLSGSAPTLDDAFGVRRRPGQRSPRTMHALAERDALLRECARTCFPDAKPTAQAQEVRRRLLRYETSAWRRDRSCIEMPEAYAGTERGFYFRILRIGQPIPGPRRLIDILSNYATNYPDFVAQADD